MSELLKKYESIDQSKLNEGAIKILNRVKTITTDFTTDDAKNNKIANDVLDEIMKKFPDSVKIVKRTPKAKPAPKKTHKATHTKKSAHTTTSTAKKSGNNIMSVAKEIQKAGESWKDAMERAKQVLKERREQVIQKQKTELEKLYALVKTKKELQGFAKSDIERDAVRSAKPRGARVVSKEGSTSNQYGTFSNKLGRKYWETRDRHADRLAPNYPKDTPLLASGGTLPNEYVSVVRWADGNYRVQLKRESMAFGRYFNDSFEDKERAEKFAKKISENNKVNYIGISTLPYDFRKSNIPEKEFLEKYYQNNKFADGGMTNLTMQNVSFAKGGSIKEVSKISAFMKYLSSISNDNAKTSNRDVNKISEFMKFLSSISNENKELKSLTLKIQDDLRGVIKSLNSKEKISKEEISSIQDDLRDVIKSTESGSFAKGGSVKKVPAYAKRRLEELREEIREERISTGEIAELQSMKQYIDPSDVELLQWAGVEEFEDDDNYAKGGKLTKSEVMRNMYKPSGDYFFEQKGNDLIVHLTSKDAGNSIDNLMDKYDVKDNGKGYHGSSYILSRKSKLANGGSLPFMTDPNFGNFQNTGAFAKGGSVKKVPAYAKRRLEELREEIREERISTGEIAELQSLAQYIDPSDVELLQWAGVPEFEEEEEEYTDFSQYDTIAYNLTEEDAVKLANEQSEKDPNSQIVLAFTGKGFNVYVKKASFELGGAFMMTDLAGHTGGSDGLGNPMPLSGVSGTYYTGLVGETGAMSSGELFMDGGAMAQNQQVINDASQSYVNYYLGEGASQGIYKDGGSIPNNYEGKTPEEIWNSLSKQQRGHFLYDHVSEIEEYKNIERLPSSEIIKAYNSEWSSLDKDIKNRFANHTREGQYAYGGKTKSRPSMRELYIENIAYLTNTREVGVDAFAKEHNLTDSELSNLMSGLGRKMISQSDFITALVGNKNNPKQKEVIAFAKSDKAYKMADGGDLGYFDNMSEEEILKSTVVFDNNGKSYDRYTVFTPDDSVFGMSEDAKGFNQYIGDKSEIPMGKHLGKKLTSVPQGIRMAVLNRMKEEYADGGALKFKVGQGEKYFDKKEKMQLTIGKESEIPNVYNVNWEDGEHSIYSADNINFFISKGIWKKLDKMADGGDVLPPSKTYGENIYKAMQKFNISDSEARKRYGQYTISQWNELLEEKMADGGGIRSKEELKKIFSEKEAIVKNLTPKQIAEMWNENSFGVKEGISKPITIEEAKKPSMKIYLENLLIENELTEDEQAKYFAKGGEIEIKTIKVGDYLQKKDNKAKAKVINIKGDSKYSTEVFIEDLYGNKVSRPLDFTRIDEWKIINEPTREINKIKKVLSEQYADGVYVKNSVKFADGGSVSEDIAECKKLVSAFCKEFGDKFGLDEEAILEKVKFQDYLGHGASVFISLSINSNVEDLKVGETRPTSGYIKLASDINPNGVTGKDDIARTYDIDIEIKGITRYTQRRTDDGRYFKSYSYGRTIEEAMDKTDTKIVYDLYPLEKKDDLKFKMSSLFADGGMMAKGGMVVYLDGEKSKSFKTKKSLYEFVRSQAGTGVKKVEIDYGNRIIPTFDTYVIEDGKLIHKGELIQKNYDKDEAEKRRLATERNINQMMGYADGGSFSDYMNSPQYKELIEKQKRLYAQLKSRVVRAVGIDEAIEFFDYEHSSIAPYRFIERAVQGNLITLDEINEELVKSALQETYELDSDEDLEEIGGSDFTYYLKNVLDGAGFKVGFVNSRLQRLNEDGSVKEIQNSYADGGFMNNVYAKGGELKGKFLAEIKVPYNFEDVVENEFEFTEFLSKSLTKKWFGNGIWGVKIIKPLFERDYSKRIVVEIEIPVGVTQGGGLDKFDVGEFISKTLTKKWFGNGIWGVDIVKGYADGGSFLEDNEGFMRADNEFNYRYPEKEVYIETLDEPIDLTSTVTIKSNEVVISPIDENIDLNDDNRIRARMTQSNRGSAENFGKINPRAFEFIDLPMPTSNKHKND